MKTNQLVHNQLRFYCDINLDLDQNIELPRNIVHQVYTVLKKRVGDHIYLFNGSNKEYKIELCEVTKSKITGYVDQFIDYNGELDTNIYLYQSLVEHTRMELIIQKCTELGVKNIYPVISNKCKIKSFSESKRERWNNIIKESSEQSFRSKIMKLDNIINFKDACINAIGLKIFCNEYETDFHLNKINTSYLKENNISDISIFVGPVSGYDQSEILHAQEKDMISVSLGKRVLRTETAAIASVSNIVNQIS